MEASRPVDVLRVDELLDAIAARAPAPGGGSTAALVAAMAAEQSGGAKTAEGLSWLAGYMRAQRRNAGARLDGRVLAQSITL